MNSISKRIGAGMIVSAFAASAFVGSAAPASAATDASQCVVVPFHTTVEHIADKYGINTTTVPGKNAVTALEQRWTQTVPAVNEVSVLQKKYVRVIPGNEEIAHQQWLYKWHFQGVEEVSRLVYRYSHMNPGKAATTYTVQQFSRTATTPDKTHQEFKYQKSETQYRFRDRVERPDNTVERKFVLGYDFVAGGTTRVNGKTIAGKWIESPGWHQLPDVITNAVWGTGGVPANLLGGSEAKPKGDVPLSTYGGPNIAVKYYASLITIDGGYTDYGPWSDWTTTNPGTDTATRDADTKIVVTPYKDGAWTTDAPGAPWVKTAEQSVTEPGTGTSKTEYLAQDGTATSDSTQAGTFKQLSFPGWNQFGPSVTKSNDDAIEPFREYLGENGSVTTDSEKAAWIPEESVAGWDRFGAPKNDITVIGQASRTAYLTKDAQGNLGETEVKSKASYFTAKDAPVDPKWVKIDEEKVVEPGGEKTPDKPVYLTKTADGVLGESEDINDATWISVDDATVDLTIWNQMVDEHGDPLEHKLITTEEVSAYPVYFNPNGEPTRTLTDANWTELTPAGWNFVDKRIIEKEKAVPPTVIEVPFLDVAAHDKVTDVPATYEACAVPSTLASTGADFTFPFSLALGAIGLGVVGVTIRARHRKAGAAN